MKHVFLIGKKEKHEIEIDPSWTRKVTIRVDGKIRAIKRLPWRGTFCKLKIGDEEILKVELKWSGIFPKIKCFVDGVPHSRMAIIPSRWEKPIHITTFLGVCGIVAVFAGFIGVYLTIGSLGEQLYGAKLPPYIVIENRNVDMVFKASDGTLHYWTVPVETLDATIVQGYYKRELIPEFFVPMLENLYDWYYEVCVSIQTLYAYYGQIVDFSTELGDFRDKIEDWKSEGIQYIDLRDSETGEIHRVVDFRPFVDEQPFSKVIPDLYHELADDEDFVYEIWYIVTQLTTYHSEIKETPRFPLETFIGSGGDCEDMAILVASMLKAAQANYTIKLVYMDADNPTDSQEVNHVIVWVETPTGYETFVDGTSKTVICPFTEVDGWYFEV